MARSGALSSRLRKIGLLAVAATLSAAVFACSSGGDSAAEPSFTPEPGRVNIRQGLFNRASPLATASFSAVLPAGWAVADLPPQDFDAVSNYPQGVIVKDGSDAALHYTLMPAGEASINMTSGFRVVQLDVAGARADVHRPITVTPESSGYRFYASFEEVPGGAGNSEPFSLEFSGRGLSSTDLDEAQAIIESIRREPPLTPPQPPEPLATPGPDWQRVNAHGFHDPSYQPLSILAPPGWRYEPGQGIDTFGGTFTDGETEIRVMYGPFAGTPIEPADEASGPASSPQHEIWEEVIDGKQVMFFRPEPGHAGQLAFTGIHASRIPGLPDITPSSSRVMSSQVFACGGSFFSSATGPEQQELVLAILRTLRAEENAGGCS
jgi:hypothetical protein